MAHWPARGAARRIRLAVALASGLIGASAIVQAAGPAELATLDLRTWGEPLDTPAGFDRASRAALLVYASTLHGLPQRDEAQLLTHLRIKRLNHASLAQWQDGERARVWRNYQLASADCRAGDWSCVGPVGDFAALGEVAQHTLAGLGEELAVWRGQLTAFSQAYLTEQMRLAALFPTVSSEIATFGSHEWSGDERDDRQFFLTFDDGPGAHTEATRVMLAQHGKTATFFVLGENLQARLKAQGAEALTRLYAGQCVASHGWEHRSHARWDDWQASVLTTRSLLLSALPQSTLLPLFRPPYGQRTADSGAFFAAQGIQVALWNLDSQDWQRALGADAIGTRMLALMLIKRRGVLLFHDVHGKARDALPGVFAALGEAVSWPDCRELAVRH